MRGIPEAETCGSVSLSRRGRLGGALLGLGICCLAGGAALADIVHLKNGKQLEGLVLDGPRPGTYEVRMGEGGSVVLAADDVERIEKKTTPAAELDERLKNVPEGDLDRLEELIIWARERQLPGRARAVARKVLEIDANNELARKELGYVVFENRWILEGELKKQKGLVRHQGEWMTAAERARRLAVEATRELDDLFGLIVNENPHVQEYALQKILAHREAAAREVIARRLKDEREAVRWVAVRALASFPVEGAGDAPARGIALDLHERALAEPREDSLPIFHFTLARFFPAESRRLLEESTRSEKDPGRRARARSLLVALETTR